MVLSPAAPLSTAQGADVFVSYAHADDEVPHGAEKGWVTTLVVELSKILKRTLGGHGASIWMDHHLAAGEHVDDVLLSRVTSSRTLLLVMSPAYQRSVWCRRELGGFVERLRPRGFADAIFIVETDPVERGDWHPAIRPLQPSRFWERGFDERAPRLLGYPVPKPDESSRYWREINELAHRIADCLRGSQGAEPKPVVWLAESTDDLLPERERFAATLSQHGFEPRPAAPYPRHAMTAYREALAHDLEQAAVLVQILGPEPGPSLPGAGRPASIVQAEAASQVALRRDVPLFRWRPRELDEARVSRVADREYRQLLTGVEASSIEEFKQRVLRALVEPRAASPDALPGPRHAPYILVKADAVDRELACDVQDSLVTLGVDVALAHEPRPELTPEQIRVAQEEQLHTCDALVLVYGRTRPAWVHSQFALSRKVLARRRTGVWGALLDGPPHPKPDVGLKSPNLLLLECRTGIDVAKLAGFVSALQV